LLLRRRGCVPPASASGCEFHRNSITRCVCARVRVRVCLDQPAPFPLAVSRSQDTRHTAGGQVGFPAPPPKPHKNGGGSGAQPHGPGPGPGPGPAGTYLLLDVIARRGRHRRRGNGVGVAALDHVPVLLARQLHGDVVVVVQVPLLPPPPTPQVAKHFQLLGRSRIGLGRQAGKAGGGPGAQHYTRTVTSPPGRER
jgi:hypothetical protein